jgi:putative transposase
MDATLCVIVTDTYSRMRASVFARHAFVELWLRQVTEVPSAQVQCWVEENIDETLTFYRLPRQHHKHLKSTNMLERLNEEIRRRTQVVRIFPNGESCLRLVRALAVETHENWLEQHRYLNMDDLCEHKKEALRSAASPPTRSA